MNCFDMLRSVARKMCFIAPLSITAIILFLSSPQTIWGYAYLTLSEKGELLEVSSDNTTSESNPIVWKQNQIGLAINLDGSGSPSKTMLSNGSNSWSDSASIAMSKWNDIDADFFWYVDSYQGGDACRTNRDQDGVNQVTWSADYCGEGWNQEVLALTRITYLIAGTGPDADAEITDIHILVNSTKSWDVYDGVTQVRSNGQPVYDLQRVLLHELGHGLGLAHPDENGQVVPAIMHSSESDAYELTNDDISGFQFLYPIPASGSGGGGVGIIFMFLLVFLVLSRQVYKN